MPEYISVETLVYEVGLEGDTATVTCHGRLVVGSTEEFYQALKEVASISRHLVLDLHDLVYVDSMGLGTLVRLYVHTKGTGCELKLLHLGKQLRNLLKMTNLMSTFASGEEHGITVA